MSTTTTTLGAPQLAAIAHNLKSHGTGPANVARIAKLFHVTEESLAGAVTLAKATRAKPVTESAVSEAPANVSPVALDRAQRFRPRGNRG